MFERTMRRVGALSFICIATIWAAPATAQDRAWLESLPDPDGFVWEKPDRPGYRYRGMTASQQRFYDYVQGKRMRGEALSGVEVLMIRSLQAARRWPEAPRPNPFFRAYINYLRQQPPEQLNTAHRLMLAQGMVLGVIPADPQLSPDSHKLVEYLQSDSFRARNLFERLFGRAESWMQFVAAAQGVDMRDQAMTPGVVPAQPFHGVQIEYAIAGATLGEPRWVHNRVVRADGTEEDLGPNLNSRYYRGTTSFAMAEGSPLMPGAVTVLVKVSTDGSRPVSGEILLQYNGPRPYYVRYGTVAPELMHHRERFNLGRWNGEPETKLFSLSVPTWPMCARIIRGNPEDTDLSGLSTTNHVEFFVSTKVGEHPGYSSTLDGPRVAFQLDTCPVAQAACADRSAREAADARWRAQVERTLQELGYEQTPEGRELAEMQQALAAGDAGWQQYVSRKQAQLAAAEGAAERELDALAANLGSGVPPTATAAPATTPPAPPPATTPPETPPATQPANGDIGGLQVGTGTDGGTTTGAADHFPRANKIAAALTYQNQQAGSVAVAVWTRDGAEVTRSQQTLGGANGWVSFSLSTGTGQDMPPGVYTLTITVGNRVIGRKTFTIGGGVG
ncbi:MAG: hypothetical protein ACOX9R_14960 [Armatimonadota bacterium]|jgi:hypothetical protein